MAVRAASTSPSGPGTGKSKTHSPSMRLRTMRQPASSAKDGRRYRLHMSLVPAEYSHR